MADAFRALIPGFARPEPPVPTRGGATVMFPEPAPPGSSADPPATVPVEPPAPQPELEVAVAPARAGRAASSVDALRDPSVRAGLMAQFHPPQAGGARTRDVAQAPTDPTATRVALTAKAMAAPGRKRGAFHTVLVESARTTLINGSVEDAVAIHQTVGIDEGYFWVIDSNDDKNETWDDVEHQVRSAAAMMSSRLERVIPDVARRDRVAFMIAFGRAAGSAHIGLHAGHLVAAQVVALNHSAKAYRDEIPAVRARIDAIAVEDLSTLARYCVGCFVASAYCVAIHSHHWLSDVEGVHKKRLDGHKRQYAKPETVTAWGIPSDIFDDTFVHKMPHPVIDAVARELVSSQTVRDMLGVMRLSSVAIAIPLKTDAENALAAVSSMCQQILSVATRYNVELDPVLCLSYDELLAFIVMSSGAAHTNEEWHALPFQRRSAVVDAWLNTQRYPIAIVTGLYRGMLDAAGTAAADTLSTSQFVTKNANQNVGAVDTGRSIVRDAANFHRTQAARVGLGGHSIGNVAAPAPLRLERDSANDFVLDLMKMVVPGARGAA